MRALLGLSVLLLLACTATPVFYLQGMISMGEYKTALAVLSLAYFVAATFMRRGRSRREKGGGDA